MSYPPPLPLASVLPVLALTCSVSRGVLSSSLPCPICCSSPQVSFFGFTRDWLNRSRYHYNNEYEPTTVQAVRDRAEEPLLFHLIASYPHRFFLPEPCQARDVLWRSTCPLCPPGSQCDKEALEIVPMLGFCYHKVRLYTSWPHALWVRLHDGHVATYIHIKFCFVCNKNCSYSSGKCCLQVRDCLRPHHCYFGSIMGNMTMGCPSPTVRCYTRPLFLHFQKCINTPSCTGGKNGWCDSKFKETLQINRGTW